MGISQSWKSDVRYAGHLMEAGLSAAASIRKGTADQPLRPVLGRAVRSAWVPALVGATIGALTAGLRRDRKRGTRAVVGSLIGGVLGFSGGVACGSRQLTGSVARQAARNISAVRDARWLEKNPIAYA
jgi:hypothetical protein